MREAPASGAQSVDAGANRGRARRVEDRTATATVPSARELIRKTEGVRYAKKTQKAKEGTEGKQAKMA